MNKMILAILVMCSIGACADLADIGDPWAQKPAEIQLIGHDLNNGWFFLPYENKATASHFSANVEDKTDVLTLVTQADKSIESAIEYLTFLSKANPDLDLSEFTNISVNALKLDGLKLHVWQLTGDVIPEPAGISLIIVLGGAMIFIRRRLL